MNHRDGNAKRPGKGLFTGCATDRLAWAALATYVLSRGLFLAGAIPPWQGPDEPGHAEYAWLVAGGHGWAPAPDRALEAAILRSMADARFHARVRAAPPATPPVRFTDLPRLSDAPTQRTDETPIGYLPFAAVDTLRRGGGDIAARLLAARLAAPCLALGTVALTACLTGWALGRRLAWPAAVMAASLPWMGFAGAVVNPDLTAAMLAAAWFAALARIERRRLSAAAAGAAVPTVAGTAVLAVLAILAALAKRTAAYLVPLTLGWLAWRAWRGWQSRPQRSPPVVALAVAVVAAGAAAAWPIGDRPAGWVRVGEPWGAERRADAARSGGWGLRVLDDDPAAWQYLEQWVRLPVGGADVRATAWLRAAGGATGGTAQLVVNDDRGTWAGATVALSADWVAVETRLRAAGDARRIRIALVPGAGTAAGLGSVEADDVGLEMTGWPGKSMADAGTAGAPIGLRGGDAEAPRRLGPVVAAAAVRYTAAARLASAVAGGDRDPWGAAGRAWAGLAFAWRSAWGGYGWLAIWPGPGFTAVAALVTLFAGLAVAIGLVRPGGAAQPGTVRTCAVGVALAIGLAVFGTLAGAGPDRLPQGRYLLAAAAPLTVVVASMADRAWPRRGPAALAALLLGMDAWVALAVVWPAFRGP